MGGIPSNTSTTPQEFDNKYSITSSLITNTLTLTYSTLLTYLIQNYKKFIAHSAPIPSNARYVVGITRDNDTGLEIIELLSGRDVGERIPLCISHRWGDISRNIECRTTGADIYKANMSQESLDLCKDLLSQGFIIWLDWLCMNQDSNDDKCGQVSIMGQIYFSGVSFVVDPSFGYAPNDVQYHIRAWTLQESFFGHVLLHIPLLTDTITSSHQSSIEVALSFCQFILQSIGWIQRLHVFRQLYKRGLAIEQKIKDGDVCEEDFVSYFSTIWAYLHASVSNIGIVDVKAAEIMTELIDVMNLRKQNNSDQQEDSGFRIAGIVEMPDDSIPFSKVLSDCIGLLSIVRLCWTYPTARNMTVLATIASRRQCFIDKDRLYCIASPLGLILGAQQCVNYDDPESTATSILWQEVSPELSASRQHTNISPDVDEQHRWLVLPYRKYGSMNFESSFIPKSWVSSDTEEEFISDKVLSILDAQGKGQLLLRVCANALLIGIGTSIQLDFGGSSSEYMIEVLQHADISLMLFFPEQDECELGRLVHDFLLGLFRGDLQPCTDHLSHSWFRWILSRIDEASEILSRAFDYINPEANIAEVRYAMREIADASHGSSFPWPPSSFQRNSIKVSWVEVA